MNGLERIGLLKMDFLGLTTLTVLHDAVRMIQQNRGVTSI
jgi:DNA polymerase III subunit alpha